jgi:FkbM family methyltransferase
MIRYFFLKLLKLTEFDFSIKHHYTGFDFYLNSYTHKGYWFYGRKREKNTINLFFEIIKPNYYVVEIGGHIGYFTTLFANLVGENGKVDVFEPSKTNIIYLSRNIKNLPLGLSKIISIVDKGAGDKNEILEFFIDPITGQNNSFVPDFEGFYKNRESSADKSVSLEKENVEVITLDSYFKNLGQCPDFIKIDVEGFEWNVILGLQSVLKENQINFMLEIQKDEEKIINFFIGQKYNVFNDEMKKINSFEDYLILKTPNIFMLHA